MPRYSHPITPHGVLVDFDTDERLRPATKLELELLERFAARHPASLPKVWTDGRRCFIDPST